MFALRIQLPHDELHAAVGDEAYQTTLHVDREVQVDLCELSADDAEVAAATSTASDALPAGRSQKEERVSESPSPFLALDAIETEAEAEAEAVDEPDPEDAQIEIERIHVPFFAGNPKAELVSGSLGFFRFAHPGGTIGLRPPPIRSNLICLLAVPPSLSSVELIGFLGGYMHYVRHMRLVREASPPHGGLLLLQFGTPATAETFRRAYHGKRYNSLEPDVAMAVHVAQARTPTPTPKPNPDLDPDLDPDPNPDPNPDPDPNPSP